MRHKKLKGLSETQLRAAAGHSVKEFAAVLSKQLSPDDSWRLMLAGAMFAMFAQMSDEEAAQILRDLADDIERGAKPTLN